MVNSVRPNTDCHKTPQKHQFVEDSHSLVIWKPFSLPTLLLNPEQLPFITVTCNILSKSVTEDYLLSWSAYKVQGRRGDLESKVK